MCVHVPSMCIQALVHQCDSGEALINSSPTLGSPPRTCLFKHNHKNSDAGIPQQCSVGLRAAEAPAFISVRQRLCRVHLSSHSHVHPAHQDTIFYYSCVFLLLNVLACSASLTLRGVLVVSRGCTTFAVVGGAGETVNLPRCVGGCDATC